MNGDFCQIPLVASRIKVRNQGGRPRPLWTGLMYCIECQDADYLPDDCDGRCQMEKGYDGGCKRSGGDRSERSCPCAKWAPKARIAAFRVWAREREKVHHDPLVSHQMAAEMGKVPTYHVPTRWSGHREE
jgi:hypothetical protein